MPDKIKVGMADWKLGRNSDILVTFGLGSCVALALWDAKDHVALMAHIMLPDSKLIRYRQDVNPAKFADTAVAVMLAEIARLGYTKDRFRAKIVGGANMFTFPDKTNSGMNIGQRNVAAVKEEITRVGWPLVAEDTGGTSGRSIEFHSTNGIIKIRTALFGEKEL